MVLFNLEELKEIDSLIDKYNALEVRKQFLNEEISKQINESELIYLIESANVLATSTKERNKERALKVATIIPHIKDSSILIIGCKIILNRLRNFITLDMLEKLYPNYTNNSLSIIEQLKEKYEQISNTVDILGEEKVLNNTQYSIYQLVESSDNVSISAPTSAGKSFIVMRIVLEYLHSNKNIVYVVPTRALINEVMSKLRSINKNKEYFITSSSETRNLRQDEFGVFVLTQERLYQLCNNKNIHIHMLIVDEAQNVMDNGRGVLLEYSIKYAQSIWKDVKTVFLSPLINNPNKLLEKFNDNNEGIYNSKEYLVRQNIIKLIRLKGRGYELRLNNQLVEKNLNIIKGSKLAQNMVNAYMGVNNKEKSIIYCNTPDMALEVCNEFYNRNILEEKNDEELNEFANFIEHYIDKNYMLVKYIRRGLAFHYGSLPVFIRLGIESLAEKGLIDIMVCTSTLLQGVNIPVQNIYVCNPRKSRSKKLDNLDFWNLIGRAGRTGFDLNGNIILVDTPSWENINKYDNKNMKIKYATDLSDEQVKEVENAFEYDEYDSKKKEFIDNIESALIFDNLIESKKGIDLNSEIIEEHVCDTILENSEIRGLIIKLIGIRPDNIKKVWNIFKNNDNNIKSFLIPYPYSDEFVDKYFEVLDIINNNLMNGTLYKLKPDVENKKNKSFRRVVFCSLAWMRGDSLRKYIFDKFHDFDDEEKVTKQVKDQIEYLNNVIRYKLVKGIYAYQEILKEYLTRTNREYMLEKIPNIAMFLELGSCDEKATELISLGLMRELALDIVKKINFYENDVVSTLKAMNISNLKLSKYEEEKLNEFIEKI